MRRRRCCIRRPSKVKSGRSVSPGFALNSAMRSIRRRAGGTCSSNRQRRPPKKSSCRSFGWLWFAGPCGPAHSSPTGRDARLPARRHRDAGRGRLRRGRSHRSASRRAVLRHGRRAVRGCCASRRTGGTGIRRCSSSRTTAPGAAAISRFTAHRPARPRHRHRGRCGGPRPPPRARPEARDGPAAAPRRSPRPDGGAAWFRPRPRLRPG